MDLSKIKQKLEELNQERQTGNDNAKYFGWNNVKWYYDDVDFIMDGLQELKKKDYSFDNLFLILLICFFSC